MRVLSLLQGDGVDYRPSALHVKLPVRDRQPRVIEWVLVIAVPAICLSRAPFTHVVIAMTQNVWRRLLQLNTASSVSSVRGQNDKAQNRSLARARGVKGRCRRRRNARLYLDVRYIVWDRMQHIPLTLYVPLQPEDVEAVEPIAILGVRKMKVGERASVRRPRSARADDR